MNYVATPADIDAFATKLTNEFGPRAQTILDNVKNAQLHLPDFGPFLGGICANAWFTHYDAVVNHVSSIVVNIQNAADRFHETAATYQSTDDAGHQQMSDLADELYKAKGTLPDAKSAPKDARSDGAGRNLSNSYYEKPGERTDYGDRMAKSLPGFSSKLAKVIPDLTGGDDVDVRKVLTDGGTLLKGLSKDWAAYAKDPLGFLISNGLSFVIKIFTPLKWFMDTVATGNPDALKAASSRFADIAKDLERLATDLVGEAQRGIPRWEGDAAIAAAARLEEFVQGIHGTAAIAGDTGGLLQLIALLSQALEDTVIGIVSDVVKWAVLIWIKALTTAPVTAGASTAEATAETELVVAQGTEKAADAATKTSSIFSRVSQVLSRMSNTLLGKGGKAKFFEEAEKFKAPTLKGEAVQSAKRLTGSDNGAKGIREKGEGYRKTIDTTVDDYSMGTDESDEEIDEQLDFQG